MFFVRILMIIECEWLFCDNVDRWLDVFFWGGVGGGGGVVYLFFGEVQGYSYFVLLEFGQIIMDGEFFFQFLDLVFGEGCFFFFWFDGQIQFVWVVVWKQIQQCQDINLKMYVGCFLVMNFLQGLGYIVCFRLFLLFIFKIKIIFFSLEKKYCLIFLCINIIQL